MHMATDSTYLLDLIAGRRRPAVKCARFRPAAVSELLVGSMYKRAQYIGEASKNHRHRFADSIADMENRKRQAAEAAAAQRAARDRGMTGDDSYDNLPDVRERRMRENTRAQLQESYRNRKDLVQKRDQADIQNEANQTKSWGDNKWVRGVTTALSLPVQTVLHAGGAVMGDAPRPGGFWKGVWDDATGVSHDVANNLQIQAEHAGHTIGTMGRAVRYGYNYATGDDSALYSLKNERDNANAMHEARIAKMLDNYHDSDLKDPNSIAGMINYGLNSAAGNFAGGTAVTMGVGGVANAAARGIGTGTQAVAGAIRGTQAVNTAARAATAAGNAARTAGAAANTAGTAAGWGSRAVQIGRNAAARGVEAIGDTVAMPFRAVGSVTHPLQSARGMGSNIAQYGRSIAHPGQIGWGRWTVNAAKPLFSDTSFKAQAAFGAMNAARKGDMRGAAGELGDIGALSALGPAYLPFMFMGGSGDGQDQYEGGYE